MLNSDSVISGVEHSEKFAASFTDALNSWVANHEIDQSVLERMAGACERAQKTFEQNPETIITTYNDPTELNRVLQTVMYAFVTGNDTMSKDIALRLLANLNQIKIMHTLCDFEVTHGDLYRCLVEDHGDFGVLDSAMGMLSLVGRIKTVVKHDLTWDILVVLSQIPVTNNVLLPVKVRMDSPLLKLLNELRFVRAVNNPDYKIRATIQDCYLHLIRTVDALVREGKEQEAALYGLSMIRTISCVTILVKVAYDKGLVYGNDGDLWIYLSKYVKAFFSDTTEELVEIAPFFKLWDAVQQRSNPSAQS